MKVEEIEGLVGWRRVLHEEDKEERDVTKESSIVSTGRHMAGAEVRKAVAGSMSLCCLKGVAALDDDRECHP